MRVLRQGCEGEDVKDWQRFLRGRELYFYIVDGDFGPKTEDSTRAFQVNNGLDDDGEVGKYTYAKAQLLDFDPFEDDSDEETKPNWPPKPDFRPLTPQQRDEVFGHIEYKPASVPGNPEAIVITNNWEAENLTYIEVPQLEKIPGMTYQGRLVGTAPARTEVHHLVATPFATLWEAWEDAGMLELVRTWGGLGCRRFIRGSRTILSNHAYSSAFDINVPWNLLGSQPALKGKKGSVRELVPIANELGWTWLGHWIKDGMHFELTKT
jgi:hypothetical protein